MLNNTGSNWAGILFQLLAKNFGLKVNGGAFLSMAQSVDFKIILKTNDSHLLESLFFGQIGLIDKNIEDAYYLQLQEDYKYLKRKYALNNSGVERPKFFRLRPDNFPTIRLSQLAFLYSRSSHLFSEIMNARTRSDFIGLFSVETTDYWRSHYNFGKSHSPRTKKLTNDFIDLLLINTVFPLRFYYFQLTGQGSVNEILDMVSEIKAEKNKIIEKFNQLRPNVAVNAMQSQALLHMKQEYCSRNSCLKCNLGTKLIKGL